MYWLPVWCNLTQCPWPHNAKRFLLILKRVVRANHLGFRIYQFFVFICFLLLLSMDLRMVFVVVAVALMISNNFRYKNENHQSHLLSPATYIHIAYCCVQSTSFQVAQCDVSNCVYRCVFLLFLCVCVFAHRSRLNVWRFERIKDLVQFCVNSFERDQNACIVVLFGYEITKYKA